MLLLELGNAWNSSALLHRSVLPAPPLTPRAVIHTHLQALTASHDTPGFPSCSDIHRLTSMSA